MPKGLSQQEFMGLLVLVQEKIGISLDDEQLKFLRLVKSSGVCIEMTQEAKANPQFQELANLLSRMHQEGLIPSFQVVDI